jgi:hypothetical protein
MNTIQVDLKAIPSDIKGWIDFEIAASNAHDISVELLNKKYVWIDNIRCAGMFDDSAPKLTVACYMDTHKWLPILVHESCHKDQYVEQAPIWRQTIEHEGELHDPITLFQTWLDGHIELKPRKLKEVVTATAAVELDCEIRSAKKIDKFYLPINTKEYIQKSNAYVWFYHVIRETRKWYPKGKSPFYMADVWTKMPTHFDNDYSTIPTRFKKLILEKCFAL